MDAPTPPATAAPQMSKMCDDCVNKYGKDIEKYKFAWERCKKKCKIPDEMSAKRNVADDCKFLKHDRDPSNMPLCANGEHEWNCMDSSRGGRVQCPEIAPVMCAMKSCDSGRDYCCQSDCGDQGGPRKCE